MANHNLKLSRLKEMIDSGLSCDNVYKVAFTFEQNARNEQKTVTVELSKVTVQTATVIHCFSIDRPQYEKDRPRNHQRWQF